MSVDGDAEQEVVSHPFPPALPLVCAAASVLPFKVYKETVWRFGRIQGYITRKYDIYLVTSLGVMGPVQVRTSK